MSEGLSHLDEEGRARMVDVGAKAETEREATAEARVRLAPDTLAMILAGNVPKGDVLATARLAGIGAAKRTAELIPLCHPLRLTSVEVEFEAGEAGALGIRATVRAFDRTGVEMEALTAASVAGLCVYDMVKAVDRAATIEDVRVVAKRGGRSGEWLREED